MIRLNKYLSMCGVCSRRNAEKMITEGRIQVNGKIVVELGTIVDEKADRVEADGRHVTPIKQHIHILLNKPRHVMTTLSDPHGRPTVAELLKGVKERVNPVGRLDFDTKGVLILTNDGELTLKITHPRYGVHKTYVVLVSGMVEPATLRRLVEGIQLGDGPASALRTRLLDKSDTQSMVEVTMGEGRKRIVRRMFDEIGHPVERLVRTAIGPIRDQSLNAGEYRTLTIDEIRSLYAAAKDVANG